MKFIYLSIIFIILTSCTDVKQLPGYRFENFKNTPAWDLALAIENNDIENVILLSKNTSLINYKDPKFKQTLLNLSIVNGKKEIFKILLDAGASTNIISGTLNDNTPLLIAIDFQKNCDIFFIMNLIKYGANPNLEVKYLENGYVKGKIPLIQAINCSDDNGNDCLSIIKILIQNNAKINVCKINSLTNKCEGVINECLLRDKMEVLKYFIIEKKIEIPDTVYTFGGIDSGNMKAYSLKEILQADNYQYINNQKAEQAKNEILKYIK